MEVSFPPGPLSPNLAGIPFLSPGPHRSLLLDPHPGLQAFPTPPTSTQVVLHKQPEDLLLDPTHSKPTNGVQ